MLIINPYLRVRLSELELTYVRSSGPGGQNVNKVNSKAVLRWNLIDSPSLNEEMRQRLLTRLGSRLTSSGELIITSDRFRDQTRNREDCMEKLQECLREAATLPKARKKTKATRSSQKKRIERKGRHSEKKSLRRSPKHD